MQHTVMHCVCDAFIKQSDAQINLCDAHINLSDAFINISDAICITQMCDQIKNFKYDHETEC